MTKRLLAGIGVLSFFFVTLVVARAQSPEIGSFSGQKIIIAGTGDSQMLLRALGRAFEAKYTGSEIEVPDSIGSSGGIKALAAGKADLARVARPLKKHENTSEFTYLLFANNPVVFAVHSSVTGVDNLEYEQIVRIYSGKINKWEQLGKSRGKIYRVIREPGDSSLKVIHKGIPGFKDIDKPAAKIIYTTPETVKVLVEHRNTIGFLPISAIKGTDLKIVRVNGIFPSTENVTTGKYNLITPYALVCRGEPTGLAGAFVEFLHSEEGKKIIIDFGAVPSR